MIPGVVGDGGRLVGWCLIFKVVLKRQDRKKKKKKKAGSRFRSAASQTSGAIDSSGEVC